ncbi:MAG: SDR family oxidoreductase [Chloroflexota bacterium]|nr:MAG: SDR family oxidoreductase [Chloroflexota bacterium]
MTHRLFALDGQVVLVAGGTGGIGQTLSEALVEYGAKVAVSGRTQAKADEFAKRLGHGAVGFVAAADDTASIRALVEKTAVAFGRVDLVLDCIGGNARHEAEDFPENDWRRILDLNLTSAFVLSQAAAKQMMKQPRIAGRPIAGKILHISSVRSALGIRAGYAAYVTAKGGLNLMVKQLATEWAEHGILVNAIAPTFIRTEQVADMLADKAFYDGLVRRIPLGRIGETEDLIGPTLFFLSPASDFVTGQTLFIDGGVTACQ